MRRGNEIISSHKQELVKLKKQLTAKINTNCYESKPNIISKEGDILGVIINELDINKDEETKTNDNDKDMEAMRYKEVGNDEFKKGNYEEAIKHYTNGIITHYDMLSILLSNRAAALIHLEKYKLAFKDATISVIINPTILKDGLDGILLRMKYN